MPWLAIAARNCWRSASRNDADDFDIISGPEVGGLEFAGKKGGGIVFNEDRYLGHAEALQQAEDSASRRQRMGLAVKLDDAFRFHG